MATTRDISKIGQSISVALESINSTIDNRFPDNNTKSITAADTRTACKYIASEGVNPYYDKLTDKVYIKVVNGFLLQKGERSATENNDILVETGNDSDKIIVVRLPWDALVYFNNVWDDNATLNVMYTEDDGEMWAPTDQETLSPFGFYDNGTIHYYMVDNQNQQDLSFVTTTMETNDEDFKTNHHIYIIAQIVNETDDIGSSEYLPILKVNSSIPRNTIR